jgi:hypothetical protein
MGFGIGLLLGAVGGGAIVFVYHTTAEKAEATAVSMYTSLHKRFDELEAVIKGKL